MKCLIKCFGSVLVGVFVFVVMVMGLLLVVYVVILILYKFIVVFVYGVFVDFLSWNGVIWYLQLDGYQVIVVLNELCSVKGDVVEVNSLVWSIFGLVVLVGYFYGGLVISEVVIGLQNVKVLVYVVVFVLDVGESVVEFVGCFLGSILGFVLVFLVFLVDGGKDFYIDQDKFCVQFVVDVLVVQVKLMVVGQCFIIDVVLYEVIILVVWKIIFLWFVYGIVDFNILLVVQVFMVKWVYVKDVEVIKGVFYVVMVFYFDVVVCLIEMVVLLK